MKFLIDLCLHTSLVTLAHNAGHVCEHVNFLGLGGDKDWQLMNRIRREDYPFVTNNRADFTALYAKEELHAGLVIIIPNVTPSRQRELFRAALSHIGERDLIKAILEVDLAGAAATGREYPYPLLWSSWRRCRASVGVSLMFSSPTMLDLIMDRPSGKAEKGSRSNTPVKRRPIEYGLHRDLNRGIHGCSSFMVPPTPAEDYSGEANATWSKAAFLLSPCRE